LRYRPLGKSGLKVSVIALGSWLTYGDAVGEAEAQACVRAAYDRGVNYFDTADVYQGGAAEVALGKALRGLPRSSYVLATKAFWPAGPGPNDRGLSRKHLMESVHASLRRLGTDYVDIFFCHRFDPETPVEETLRTLEDLVRQGKVLYPAVSEWTAAQMAQALGIADARGYTRIVADQPLYNLFDRTIEAEILPLAQREGIGLVVYSPLAQGVLTGKYRRGQAPPPGSRGASPQLSRFLGRYLTEDVLAKVERLQALAREAGTTLARMSLAWTLRHPQVSSAIVGATRPEQVEDNVQAADLDLGPEVWQRVEEILAS
jgi:voltage-dependent potassium channel beta subunit